MKYAVIFTAFGLACLALAALSGSLPVALLSGCMGVAFGGVGLAYAGLGPRAFLKRPDGRLSPLSYLLYWPYLLLNAFSLRAFRRAGRENAYNRIGDHIYLGCRLSRGDEAGLAQLGIASVLDLTSEFSELPALRSLNYRCIPLLDTRPPTVAQLRDGAEWLRRQSESGPVYVHCALGHGRSATFVAAYLLASGQAATVDEAIAMVTGYRPRVGLSVAQRQVLEELERDLHSQ